MMKKEITFLKSGSVTWASRSGKTEEQRYISKGDKMLLTVKPHEEGDVLSELNVVELWDGKWSILMPLENVKIPA
jgi:hypothetical protein